MKERRNTAREGKIPYCGARLLPAGLSLQNMQKQAYTPNGICLFFILPIHLFIRISHRIR